MTVVDPGSDQSSAGRLDDLDSFLCVQRGLNLKSSWHKAVIFAPVVEPQLLAYLSDVAYVPDVVVGKSFALTSK